MSTVRTFGRNILSNWAGYGVNAVVTLILTPIVVNSLGDARYGLWVLANSVVGYYGLLDFGFRAGVTQYLTRYLASKQFDLLNRSASSAFVALSVVGVVVFLASLGLGFLAPTFVDGVSTELASEALWCIALFGAAGAVQFALFPFSATLTATQRFDIANAVGITTRILMAIGIYAVLANGYGLIAVCAVTVSANILGDFARVPIAHWLVGELRIRPRLAAWERCREIMSFGVWNFLIAIGQAVMVHGTPWIITAVFTDRPLDAAGFYNLAAAVYFNLYSVLDPVVRVFYPAATEFHAQNRTAALQDLYRNGSRFVVLLVGLAFVLGWFLIPSFYKLWLGAKYFAQGSYGTPDDLAAIARILLIALVVTFFTGVGHQILLGMKHVRALAILVACASATFAVSAWLLAPTMGLEGVAWSVVGAVLLFRTIAYPLAVSQRIGVSIFSYIAAVLPRATAVAAPTAAMAYWLSSSYEPQSLLTFFLLAGTMGAAALPFAIGIGLTRKERETYIWSRLPLPASLRRV